MDALHTTLTKDTLSFDHVKSKKMGGGNERENCKASCRSCNTRKGGDMTAFMFMKVVLKKRPRCLALTSRKKDCKRPVAEGNRKFCTDHEPPKNAANKKPPPFDEFDGYYYWKE